MSRINFHNFPPEPEEPEPETPPVIHVEEEGPVDPENEEERFLDKELVIIDTDSGTDDARAIFMMLRAHYSLTIPIKILAFTCVNGNTTLSNVEINVTRVLNTADEFLIPIYRGANTALVASKSIHEVPPYYGKDGFGDAGFPKIVPRTDETEDAFSVIINLLLKYPGRVSILALGPLTNLAIAISKMPEIKSLPKRIVILGGTSKAMGNTTICGEFNFVTDPESARIVLETFTCSMAIVTWETLIESAAMPRDFRVNVLGKIKTAREELLDKADTKTLAKNMPNWIEADSAVAAFLIEPRIASKKEKQYCTVELCGEFTRGMMVVDRIKKLKKKPNVTLITKVNLRLFEKMLIWGVSNTPSYD